MGERRVACPAAAEVQEGDVLRVPVRGVPFLPGETLRAYRVQHAGQLAAVDGRAAPPGAGAFEVPQGLRRGARGAHRMDAGDPRPPCLALEFRAEYLARRPERWVATVSADPDELYPPDAAVDLAELGLGPPAHAAAEHAAAEHAAAEHAAAEAWREGLACTWHAWRGTRVQIQGVRRLRSVTPPRISAVFV